jgi:hypothetical protein
MMKMILSTNTTPFQKQLLLFLYAWIGVLHLPIGTVPTLSGLTLYHLGHSLLLFLLGSLFLNPLLLLILLS